MRIKTLFFLLVAALCLPAFADGSNGMTRIQRAELDLANLRAMAKDVTNDADRVVWDRRIELAEKEAGNARRLTELELKEKAVAMARRSSKDTGSELHDLLRTIEQDTSAIAASITDIEKKLRQVKDARAAKESEKSKISGEEADQKKADVDQALQTLDAQHEALTLQREARDIQTRLANEAHRVDEFLRKDALNPTPSIRAILSMRHAAEDAVKGAGSFAALVQRQQAQRESVAEKFAIETELFSHLDEEIKTLEDMYATVRTSIFSFKKTDTALLERKQRIVTMLAQAKSQKTALGERIEFRRQQVAALDESIGSAAKAHDLRDLENRHLTNESTAMMQRFLRRITLPTAIVLGLLFVNIVLGGLILPLFFKRDNLLVARRITSYLIIMVVIFVLVVSFMEDLKSIATLLGLVGAAIVIALQDLCSAFAGWFCIVSGRKVRVGDRVEIDGHKGDIVDIQLLRTTMLELNSWLGVDEQTGRVLTIPNSFIFKSHVLNYTRMHPYIWDKLDITVTYETPFREARELLLRILEEETREEFAEAQKAEVEAEHRFGLPETKYIPKIYTSLADSGVLFTLLYVAHYKKSSSTRSKIGTRILSEFEKDLRMQLAYPTQREIKSEEAPHTK